MWRSIRARLTALATVVVAAVLVLTAVALLTSQRRLLTDNLDESLRTRGAELAETASNGIADTPLAMSGDDDAIAQIVSADGSVVASTANFDGRDALLAPTEGSTVSRSAQVFRGEPGFRIVGVRRGDIFVFTAAPLDDISESIAALRSGLAIAIPIVLVVLAALVWWLTGRTLEPVEAIRREVADISSRNLDRRVPEPGTGDEIQRLAGTMNAMLDRIEVAVERQERFVADASHELRSPLTRIRTELEVDLADPENADLAATHRSVLDETELLQRLVENLLTLARLDSGPGRPTHPVDLDDIVLAETRRLRDHTSLRIDTSAVSAAQIDGDADSLTRVVRNLLDNAGRHAQAVVVVSLEQHAELTILAVSDDGPGVPPEHHLDVFDRFTRLDQSRHSGHGGTGLGLAITRDIVQRHGGTIRVDGDHSPGARFVVELAR